MLRSKQSILAAVAMAILGIVAISGCRKSGANPFPPSGAIAGWEKSSDTRIFAARDLWQYIDGDAEQYVQAGVVSTSTSDYKYHGQLEAVVDVYTMGGSDGAQKILARSHSGDSKSIQLGEEALQYAQSVTFRKGRYIVRIVAYETTPATSQALLSLAHGVEGKL